jgi:hypothetical protein
VDGQSTSCGQSGRVQQPKLEPEQVTRLFELGWTREDVTNMAPDAALAILNYKPTGTAADDVEVF